MIHYIIVNLCVIVGCVLTNIAVKDYGVLQDKELYEEAKKDNKAISDKARKKKKIRRKRKRK